MDEAATTADIDSGLPAIAALVAQPLTMSSAAELIVGLLERGFEAGGCALRMRIGHSDVKAVSGIDPHGSVPIEGPIVVTTAPLLVEGTQRGDLTFVDLPQRHAHAVQLAATLAAAVIITRQIDGRIGVESVRASLLEFATRLRGPMTEELADELRGLLLEMPGVARVAVALGGTVALPERGDMIRRVVCEPPDNFEIAVSLDGTRSAELETTDAVLQVLDILAEACDRATELRSLRELVETDELTGVARRRTVTRDLHRAIARAERHREALSILVCDIDQLAAINGSLGRSRGDECLRSLAFALESMTRLYDSVGRVGDDEFVVILSSTSTNGALQVAKRAVRMSEQVLGRVVGDGNLVRVAIGVAGFPANGDDPPALLASGFEALAVAKASAGRVALPPISP